MPSDTPLQPSLSHDLIKNRSKKRSRDDAPAHTLRSDSPKDKKKKRKHHDVSTEPAQTSSKRKKQKQKQKQNDKAQPSKVISDTPPDASTGVIEPQAPAEPLDEEAQASAAALLSAILTLAATGAPDMMNLPPPQIDLNYLPPIAQGSQPHFVPMAMEHTLPYLSNPYMQPVPDPAAIANMDLPIADLSLGSNEDVLRALQDLDITKIAGVLKTLGDAAAAAANVSPLPTSPISPSFYTPAIPLPHRSPPINGYPAPSNAILGIPPKAPPPVRTMSPTYSVPEQHGNPEHATLLSTKWLGAAKLAELVRTEGTQ